jgi:hypothetical protein
MARGPIPADASSSAEISTDVMREYYSKLWKEAEEDNAALMQPPAFSGSVDELEKYLESLDAQHGA